MPGFEDEIRYIGLYGHNRVVKGIIYDDLYMDWSDKFVRNRANDNQKNIS
jgi:hypothetical protein